MHLQCEPEACFQMTVFITLGKKLLPERAQHHPDGYILTASRMNMTVTSYMFQVAAMMASGGQLMRPLLASLVSMK